MKIINISNDTNACKIVDKDGYTIILKGFHFINKREYSLCKDLKTLKIEYKNVHECVYADPKIDESSAFWRAISHPVGIIIIYNYILSRFGCCESNAPGIITFIVLNLLLPVLCAIVIFSYKVIESLSKSNFEWILLDSFINTNIYMYIFGDYKVIVLKNGIVEGYFKKLD